jgi:prophage maintenance system killer protein
LIRPTVDLSIGLNSAVRRTDEWFDEPDDHARLERALSAIDDIDDIVTAAAVAAFRVTRAQAFGEANKRTALLIARWILDRNGKDGSSIIPPGDRAIADLLVRAAAGSDVESELVSLFRSRAGIEPTH